MHVLQIRNVNDYVYQKLSESAKRNHRSLAGEVLHILESAVGAGANRETGEYDQLFREIENTRLAMVRESGVSPSSVDLIREDRDR